jgi:luciferase family oxidoreductase group 1
VEEFMTKITLSVLDQSPVASGRSASAAIQETVQLAQACEKLGYHRYWLAEHHNTLGLAGSSPEVLISHVASQTSTIRLGSGGVMLSHYSPLKVAENFRMLETIYPGRIDLGLGRAPGGDYRATMALHRGQVRGIEEYEEQIKETLGFLHQALPADHPYAKIVAMPEGSSAPEVWLLGSSDQSAIYAAQLGLGFSFAHFINGYGGSRVMRAYQAYFARSAHASFTQPMGNLAIFALCAETEEEVERLVSSLDLRLLLFAQGKRVQVPSVEEARTYPYTPGDMELIRMNRKRMVIGTPQQVKAQLLALGEQYGVGEFVIVTICHDFTARLRSYELLAEVFASDSSSSTP